LSATCREFISIYIEVLKILFYFFLCTGIKLLKFLYRPPVSSSYGLPPQADSGPTAAQRSAAVAAAAAAAAGGAVVGPPTTLLRPSYPPGAVPVRYVVPPGPPSAYPATNGQVYVRQSPQVTEV
jgi:hypothetical protein